MLSPVILRMGSVGDNTEQRLKPEVDKVGIICNHFCQSFHNNVLSEILKFCFYAVSTFNYPLSVVNFSLMVDNVFCCEPVFWRFKQENAAKLTLLSSKNSRMFLY